MILYKEFIKKKFENLLYRLNVSLYITYINRLQRCFMIVLYYVQFTMQNAKYTMSAQH